VVNWYQIRFLNITDAFLQFYLL